MTRASQVSRRDALRLLGAGTAGFTIALHLPAKGRRALAAEAGGDAATFAPNAFVRVAPDNTVTVLCKHIEFGQGPATGLATLVADELDADWSQMRAELAPSNPQAYANLFYKMQGTGGSTAIANSFMQMREAGATARAMLVAAAAKQWKVPARQIAVQKGVVSHARSERQATFGELAEAAAKQKAPKNVNLKKPEQWTLIGTDVAKLDTMDKCTGQTVFTLDRYPDGVVTSVVAHPPAFGATVKTVDDSKARAVPGVVHVAQLPAGGVAVYAKNTYAALEARDALEIEWDTSKAETRSSQAMFTAYSKAVATAGTEAANKGDVDKALDGAKAYEAEYLFPFLAHAPMEPLDAVVALGEGSAEIWMGAQSTTMDHMAFSKVLGLPMEKIALHVDYAGGSFGRRAQPDSSFAVEAAMVAKAYSGKEPVKLMWTRVDDIRGGYYRPLCVQKLRGAVDDQGNIVAWDQQIAAASMVQGTAMEPIMVQNGVDASMVEGARDLPYAIANHRVGNHLLNNGVPGLWWRSVGHTQNGYSTETFIDELLELVGKDPVEGRLALLRDHPRHTAVLEHAAALARWSGAKAANGRARGVAVHKSFGSVVAEIAEVSKGPDGLPKVHKVWCAVDCGVAVNPNVIRAQMEGGIGYGLGAALFNEINIEEGGGVREANFDTYRSLRINEMPDIEVDVIKSSEAPTGVGEPGLPPIAPAVANAWRVLTGEKVRRLPFARSVGGTSK